MNATTSTHSVAPEDPTEDDLGLLEALGARFRQAVGDHEPARRCSPPMRISGRSFSTTFRRSCAKPIPAAPAGGSSSATAGWSPSPRRGRRIGPLGERSRRLRVRGRPAVQGGRQGARDRRLCLAGPGLGKAGDRTLAAFFRDAAGCDAAPASSAVAEQVMAEKSEDYDPPAWAHRVSVEGRAERREASRLRAALPQREGRRAGRWLMALHERLARSRRSSTPPGGDRLARGCDGAARLLPCAVDDGGDPPGGSGGPYAVPSGAPPVQRQDASPPVSAADRRAVGGQHRPGGEGDEGA